LSGADSIICWHPDRPLRHGERRGSRKDKEGVMAVKKKSKKPAKSMGKKQMKKTKGGASDAFLKLNSLSRPSITPTVSNTFVKIELENKP
jgi:hypothetical protein